jgi:hypothetical protein
MIYLIGPGISRIDLGSVNNLSSNLSTVEALLIASPEKVSTRVPIPYTLYISDYSIIHRKNRIPKKVS